MRPSTILLLSLLGFLLVAGASAQESEVEFVPSLGRSHFAVDLDAMFVQHRTFETDEAGVYIGLAGYGHLGGDWYLGGEIGAGSSVTIFASDESSYMPIEVNFKRGFSLSPSWVAELGAGLSYSRVHFSHDSLFSSNDLLEINEWVGGLQILGGIVFKPGGMLLGLKLKYQLTADANEVADFYSADEGWDYSNFKIGVQIGFLGSK